MMYFIIWTPSIIHQIENVQADMMARLDNNADEAMISSVLQQIPDLMTANILNYHLLLSIEDF